MEFDFNINHLFPDIISLVRLDVLSAKQGIQKAQLQKNLQIVIDELGKKSAKAQLLSGSITNLEKSLLHGHHIYVLKDANSSNGHGSVIGFIKVGKKRLFLLDFYGNHNEMHPLCVLDFYVHESQQRRGCGLRLFKHVLTNENVKANHLAVDRPSHKFSSFLKKHFNLWVTIPQVNNFVIFDGFFKNRTDPIRSSNSRNNTNSQLRPLSRAVSDDMIRKNRIAHSEVATLKNLRPVSGCETALNQGHDFYSNRNNRRRRWNPDGTWQSTSNHSAPTRANLYSRFSHETRHPNGLPPIHPSRLQLHHQNSNNHNVDAQGSKARHSTLDASGETIPTMEIDADKIPVRPKESSPLTQSSPIISNSGNEAATFPCENTKSADNPSEMSRTIKSGGYVPRYNQPSDMLAELKAKDKLRLEPSPPPNARYPQSQHNVRRKHLHHKSSWNVFGVPSAQYWTPN